jgi:hypothetical protein
VQDLASAEHLGSSGRKQWKPQEQVEQVEHLDQVEVQEVVAGLAETGLKWNIRIQRKRRIQREQVEHQD